MGKTARRSLTLVASLLVFVLGFQVTASFNLAAAQRAPKKPPTMTADQRVAHVLARLTYGARPGDFERVKAMGVETFVSQQLDPDSIDNSAMIAKLRRLPTLNMATPVIIEQYTPPKPVASPSPVPAKPADVMTVADQKPIAQNDEKQEAGKMPAVQTAMQNEMVKDDAGKMPLQTPKPTPPPKNPQMVINDLQRAKLLRAVYSDQQLYELMVDFWENHFSIFANKDDDRYLLTAFDRETIRPFAMGRFRDLLGATAHSPAMLFYLDNWRSSVPRPYPAKGEKPAGVDGGFNENYARELMELHTLGVDGGYTQKDVQEVARCFSGWTIQKPNEQGLFVYRPGFHDDGEKIVLGHRILAGGGYADGERVLDLLATHPATAKFIATKLARRFISDDPPQAVIDRAAAVFLKTDGSIRETLRAIITSPEFFSPASYRAKTRSPLEYVAAAMRALNAETDGDRPVLDLISRMGQPLFGRITPDGYSDRAEQWLSSGAMIVRLNFASALAANRIKGTSIKYSALLNGTDQSSKEAVAGKLMQLTVPVDFSSASRAVLDKVVHSDAPVNSSSPPTTVSAAFDPKAAQTPGTPAAYVSELVTLLVGSPEFQHR